MASDVEARELDRGLEYNQRALAGPSRELHSSWMCALGESGTCCRRVCPGGVWPLRTQQAGLHQLQGSWFLVTLIFEELRSAGESLAKLQRIKMCTWEGRAGRWRRIKKTLG